MRWILSLISFLVFVSGLPVSVLADENTNLFTQSWCTERRVESDVTCVQVMPRETWKSLFPLPWRRDQAMRLNRQNKELVAGQWVIVPPSNGYVPEFVPFPQRVSTFVNERDVIIFSPKVLAWAHYAYGQLVRWGPAIGGMDTHRTIIDESLRPFTEVASAARRSTEYPEDCAKRDEDGDIVDLSECAAIPYFLRFTSGGQGIHERTIYGDNASHGCVGVFAEDAVYLSVLVRERVGRSKFGWLTPEQIAKSPPLMVLPYNVRPESYLADVRVAQR